ncbi:Gonadal protein gdl [Schistosoma japonicum]|nr:Gonadal protein gdl [Schistosoma japonicum]
MSFQPPIYYPTDLSDLHQSTTTTSVEEDHVNKEYFQQKVYYYLNELRCFVHQAPFDIQTGISEDMIAQLAHILAEGKIFLTVSELVNSQRIEEQILHKQLIDLRSEQSACRSTLRRKHREEISMNSSRPHHLPVLHKEHEQEMQRLTKNQSDALRNLSFRILDSLDGRVVEQQLTLERLGVPAFLRTTDPQIIRIQMRILDWIVRLSRRSLPSSNLLNLETISSPWPP